MYSSSMQPSTECGTQALLYKHGGVRASTEVVGRVPMVGRGWARKSVAGEAGRETMASLNFRGNDYREPCSRQTEIKTRQHLEMMDRLACIDGIPRSVGDAWSRGRLSAIFALSPPTGLSLTLQSTPQTPQTWWIYLAFHI